MATVIVEQFNPASGCWNRLYEVDQRDFNPDEPITVNKYGGQYRTRIVGVEDIVEEEVVTEDPAVEETIEVEELDIRKKFFHAFDCDDNQD